MIRRAIVKCKTQRKTIIYPLNYELTKVVQFKFCSGHPKNSQFSAFMGLNKDLDELRIKEAKDEKKDVREYSFVIIAALTILGGGFFVLYLDNGVKFQFELLCNQLKLKIITSPKHRVDIIEESLTKISEFLRKHPYDYGKCTNSLLFFSSFLENMKNPALAMKIAEIY